MLVKMGQTSSFPKSRRRSLRSPFLFRRSSKANLSHTFSLPEECSKIEQLNVNFASEEELMTLPGINREIAKGIIRHRQQIGRFRKIEDLALVPGIGAENLDRIKAEVCVRSNNSNSNSRAQSVDSLKCETRIQSKLINLNKASVFDLQETLGITQEMAANIVCYRTKKGDFKKIEDLLKVKSISAMRYTNMCQHLTIEDESGDSNLSRTTSASEVRTNGSVLANGTSTPTKHRKTSSAPVKLHVANGLPSPSSLGDIFDLLSAYSHRPIPEEDFRFKRNGKDAIRVATWNLDGFSFEKAQNMGVREVVCRTILENRWSIVCFQDVLEEEALQLIVDELNFPRLRKVTEFRSNSREWQCSVLDSHLAFIYDTQSGSIGVDMITLKQETVEEYRAALAEFTVGLVRLQILNVELHEKVPVEMIEEKLKELKDPNQLVVLGDFTNLVCGDQRREIGNLQAILPVQSNTSSNNVKTKYSDNILVSGNVKSLLTGSWSVVRQGLTHLAIPNGWSWGGTVSPHCPIWTELYVAPPSENGF